MNARNRGRALHAALLAALLLPTGILAEVSTDPLGSHAVNIIIMGAVVDDPDPIGIVWRPFRPLPLERILNASGDARGDGRPSVAYKTVAENPASVQSRPVVVWAYNTGGDFDIALAEWTGSSWSPAEFLTAGTVDELDPRVFIEEDGTMHVVWWTDETVDRVFLATRPASPAPWSDAEEVIAGGRRPSVAVFDGVLRVSYERDSTVPAMAQDVVVLRSETGGGFSQEFVASAARSEPMDAVLHATNGKLWVDWKHAAGTFGCAQRGSAGWGAVEEQPWPDAHWVGVDDARKIVRRRVLGN